MSRVHWWGAAFGAGVLTSAVLFAPPATAATSTSSAAKAAPAVAAPAHPHGKASVKHHGDAHDHGKPAAKPTKHHHGHHPHGGGSYPPNATPQIALSGPAHTHRHFIVPLTTKVTVNGKATTGAPAGLYKSDNGKTGWTLVSTGTTKSDGTVSFSYKAHYTQYLQVVSGAGRSNVYKVDVWAQRR